MTLRKLDSGACLVGRGPPARTEYPWPCPRPAAGAARPAGSAELAGKVLHLPTATRHSLTADKRRVELRLAEATRPRRPAWWAGEALCRTCLRARGRGGHVHDGTAVVVRLAPRGGRERRTRRQARVGYSSTPRTRPAALGGEARPPGDVWALRRIRGFRRGSGPAGAIGNRGAVAVECPPPPSLRVRTNRTWTAIRLRRGAPPSGAVRPESAGQRRSRDPAGALSPLGRLPVA